MFLQLKINLTSLNLMEKAGNACANKIIKDIKDVNGSVTHKLPIRGITGVMASNSLEILIE